MRIWKWTLDITDRQTISVPEGCKLLTVQMQGEHPQLWAMCDPEAEMADLRIAICGTGNPLPDENAEYVATFQSHGGALVWHVFELPIIHAATGG